MFGLSANEAFILGVAVLWVYSAAVAALPEPVASSTVFYSWVYKFLKAISGDLTAKFGTYIPNTDATPYGLHGEPYNPSKPPLGGANTLNLNK